MKIELYLANKIAVKASRAPFINTDILGHVLYLSGYKSRVFTLPPQNNPKNLYQSFWKEKFLQQHYSKLIKIFVVILESETFVL